MGKEWTVECGHQLWKTWIMKTLTDKAMSLTAGDNITILNKKGATLAP